LQEDSEEKENDVAGEWVARFYEPLLLLARKVVGGASRLEPAELLHESYLRMREQRSERWQEPRHFFAIAAQTMRRVLIDSLRRGRAEKRGGTEILVPLVEARDVPDAQPSQTSLQQALWVLGRNKPRQRQIVELRFLSGLTIQETAGRLGVAPVTVERESREARDWLRRQLWESQPTARPRTPAEGRKSAPPPPDRPPGRLAEEQSPLQTSLLGVRTLDFRK